MRLAIERVKLANRIEKVRKEEAADDVDKDDVPDDAEKAADMALQSQDGAAKSQEGRMSRAQQADIFYATVITKAKEMKTLAETDALEKAATSSSMSKR